MGGCSYKIYIFMLSVNLSVKYSVSAFNLSPKPNVVFREPTIRTYLPKVESSYFGFSLNLRESSVLVGAPRAQSSLESQRKVNETGAVYKCSINTRECMPYHFDILGNTMVEQTDFTYESEKKDNQWLGASMDGGSKDTDRFVVCAPRLLANLNTDYLVHGVCYWTPNTIGSRPKSIKKIAPLRLKSKQIKTLNNKRYYYYMFGEQGLSVHLGENSEEIIIGAPGIHTWKGSIIRYRSRIKEDIGGLSRREVKLNQITEQDKLEYVSEIPDPELWNQPNDSYFGYAVSSGFFEGRDSIRLLYVASAPQADSQSGEVYLFDIINTFFGEKTIEKLYTFRGSQFGEYFGYALLSEDFNADGLLDLAVTAPTYNTKESYESGAVYIFINKGQLNFELAAILTSKAGLPGRFGTTITSLGDINHDGYKDIAVGAPFENNGVVYIFLGNEIGISTQPIQKILAPKMNYPEKSYLFGHGISKGVDIDMNGFNDLAIGAPNADAVFLFKAYPVVKIIATVKSLSREVQIDQRKFEFQVCWLIETTSTKIFKQDIALKLLVDQQVKRVFISDKDLNVTATRNRQCRIFAAFVKVSLAEIFHPIEIELQYDLINKIPDSDEFCEFCAVVSPLDPTKTIEKIAFSTGCKEKICIANLKLTSSNLEPFYTLGSSKTLTIHYKIENFGETAYLPQINISSSNRMPFGKIPSSCKIIDFVMLCDLYKGRPMYNGQKDSLTVVFDTTRLEGNSMKITTKVFSAGNEESLSDNIIEHVVELQELSEIVVIGTAITPNINLESGLNKTDILNTIEIQNNGPSVVKNLYIILSIPVSYLTTHSLKRIQVVDFGNISVVGMHNGKTLNPVFYQNNTILTQHNLQSSTLVDKLISANFDSSKPGYSYELNPIEKVEHNIMVQNKQIKDRTIEKSYADSIPDKLIGWLPFNRTIFFNCANPQTILCIQAIIKVHNLQVGGNGVTIQTRINLDLNEVNKILEEPKEFFVLSTLLDFVKIGDREGKTLITDKSVPHNIISKHQFNITPIWVYVVSSLGGLLLLLLITYGLYRLGFFRRAKKDELQKLYRESQKYTEEDTEGED